MTHAPLQCEWALSQGLRLLAHVAPNQPSLHIHLRIFKIYLKKKLNLVFFIDLILNMIFPIGPISRVYSIGPILKVIGSIIIAWLSPRQGFFCHWRICISITKICISITRICIGTSAFSIKYKFWYMTNSTALYDTLWFVKIFALIMKLAMSKKLKKLCHELAITRNYVSIEWNLACHTHKLQETVCKLHVAHCMTWPCTARPHTAPLHAHLQHHLLPLDPPLPKYNRAIHCAMVGRVADRRNSRMGDHLNFRNVGK